MITRSDTRVFHEPFGETFYYGTEAGSGRYASQPRVAATYQSIAENMRNTVASGVKPLVFTKDISYFIDGRIGELTVPASTTHTFIVRDPRAAIRSLYSKSCIDNEQTKWTYFDPKEAGFVQLHQIFLYVRDMLGQKPVIVDAADLIADPEGMLRSYCLAVDIPFDKCMLSWEPGPVPEWGPIEPLKPGWHDDAIQSNGFHRSKAKHSNATAEGAAPDPRFDSEALRVATEQAVGLYKEMHALRLAPTT
jgi:hypothetical protein